MSEQEHKEAAEKFDEVVNMTPSELQKWLDTDESKAVGQKSDGDESIGHESGRKIIEIQAKKKSDLTDDDYHQMQRVVSYVGRHLAQEPSKEAIEDSKWRYSLMNWGHDPMKK